MGTAPGAERGHSQRHVVREDVPRVAGLGEQAEAVAEREARARQDRKREAERRIGIGAAPVRRAEVIVSGDCRARRHTMAACKCVANYYACQPFPMIRFLMRRSLCCGMVTSSS